MFWRLRWVWSPEAPLQPSRQPHWKQRPLAPWKERGDGATAPQHTAQHWQRPARLPNHSALPRLFSAPGNQARAGGGAEPTCSAEAGSSLVPEPDLVPPSTRGHPSKELPGVRCRWKLPPSSLKCAPCMPNGVAPLCVRRVRAAPRASPPRTTQNSPPLSYKGRPQGPAMQQVYLLPLRSLITSQPLPHGVTPASGCEHSSGHFSAQVPDFSIF